MAKAEAGRARPRHQPEGVLPLRGPRAGRGGPRPRGHGGEVHPGRRAQLLATPTWTSAAASSFLVGCRIAPYSHGNLLNHAPDRDRKLLLHKREILKLGGKVTERGLTLVPLRAYMKNGRVKMEIGLARGKHAHDKRDVDQEEGPGAGGAGRRCARRN